MVLAIAAGRTRRRRAHYALVFLTVTLLSAAIYQAEVFGRSFVFESWRLWVHLGFAFAALGVLPGVAVTGVRLARAQASRAVHRRWVTAFVALTVAAMLTAGWMFLSATPVEA